MKHRNRKVKKIEKDIQKGVIANFIYLLIDLV